MSAAAPAPRPTVRVRSADAARPSPRHLPPRPVRSPAESPAAKPALRVVSARRVAPRAPFVLVVSGLLAAALVTVLTLNTWLAQGSFTLRQLQLTQQQLNDQVQAAQQALAADANPAALAARAGALGLVPAPNPVFRQGSAVLGVPEPATSPPMPAPSPAVSASAPAAQPTPHPSTTPTPHPTPTAAPRASASAEPRPASSAPARSASATRTPSPSPARSGARSPTPGSTPPPTPGRR